MDNSWVTKCNITEKVDYKRLEEQLVSLEEINHYSKAIENIQKGRAQQSDWATINAVDRKWLQNYKTLGGYSLPIQEHHIIPKALKNNSVVQLAVKAGYSFEGQQNLMPVLAFRIDEAGGQHASHPQYNKYVSSELENFRTDNPNATPQDAYNFVVSLNSKLRTEIRVNSQEKINDIGQKLSSKQKN